MFYSIYATGENIPGSDVSRCVGALSLVERELSTNESDIHPECNFSGNSFRERGRDRGRERKRESAIRLYASTRVHRRCVSEEGNTKLIKMSYRIYLIRRRTPLQFKNSYTLRATQLHHTMVV